MENTNTDQNSGTPVSTGKGLGVAGFVISLVALVLWVFIAGAAVIAAALGGGMGLACFWLIVSLLGTVLSIMGMMKASKAKAKKGLAITGMILGIVATALSVRTVMAVNEVHSTVGDKGMDALKDLGKMMNDSLSRHMNEAVDSLTKHE